MIASFLLAAAVAVLPAPVAGDFDRDGKSDLAEVVRGPESGYSLIVRRGAERRKPVSIASFNELAGVYVTTHPPGRQKTWCAKGGGPKTAPCPRIEVTLSGDTLAFGTAEASLLVATWNGRSFDVIALSD
jgi:hypothetical protein